MDKLITMKKFIEKDLEINKILEDSIIGEFAFSTKVVREQASQRYIEGVERYLNKNIDEKMEAFLRG
jgi:hypothetical protein